MNKIFSWALGNGRSQPNRPKKRINLALQGGGAHGAFTWGVLDQLLEDGRIGIDGVSGASAGALNAVMLVDGLIRGGRDEARKRLADFWRAASLGGDLPELQRNAVDRLFSFLPLEESPVGLWFKAVSRYLSPYDLNPLNINPLKDLITRFVDFDAVRKNASPQLFVSATNVQTGRLRIFPHDKITADVIVASACLPHLFRAVEIDGVPYWDGGYLGNPSIFPLFRTTTTEDVLLVQINPLARQTTPTTNREIMSRLNEITFNSPLMGELRAIEFVGRLIDKGQLPRGVGPGQYRRINMHRVELEVAAKTLDTTGRLNTDYDFFEMLRDNGRRAARRFLDAHFDDIGVQGTVDLAAEISAEWA
jgi:NTE family protein